MFISKRLVSGSLLAATIWGSSLLAYNLDTALEKFGSRGESLQDLESSFREYVGILNSDPNMKTKTFAALQMGRLALFSNMLPKIAQNVEVHDDTKRALLEECVSEVEKIKDSKSQVYQYIKIACTSLRAKLSKPGIFGAADRLSWALKVQSAQKDALDSTTEGGRKVAGVEAGGILRIISAVRANSAAKMLPGMYNPQEGYEFAKVALGAPNRFIEPFGEIDGKKFYDNSYYFVTAAAQYSIESGDDQYLKEGLAQAELALQDYARREKEETLPEGREPESLYYKKKLEEAKASLNVCVGKPKWEQCTQKGLDAL